MNTPPVQNSPQAEVISVIVPVYNVEKFLRKCLDSIVNQTYPHLEIILVNDGSTDSSGEICEEYAARDPRIKVFHKENGGQSSSRNYGLRYVTGKYLAYVDSDDWLALDVYERCIERFQTNEQIDIVFFDLESVYKDGPNARLYVNLEEAGVSQEEGLYRYILERYSWGEDVNPAVWNRVYKTEPIKDLRFVEGKKYEDVLYTLLVCTRIRGYSLVAPKGTYVGYYYNRMNENSTTYRIQAYISHMFELLLDKYQECQNDCPELLPYIGTLASKRFEGTLQEPNLTDEALQELSRYLKSVYALDHLDGGWKKELKRTFIKHFPRLFVRLFYKKWLPALPKNE